MSKPGQPCWFRHLLKQRNNHMAGQEAEIHREYTLGLPSGLPLDGNHIPSNGTALAT